MFLLIIKMLSQVFDYAEKSNSSLIITIPKNYDCVQQLFHRSTTQKLIYQSPIPIQSLHE